MTLQELVALPIAGNHYSDCELFNQIDKFVHDETNSLSDRVAALHHMSVNVMGCSIEHDKGKTDAEIVEEHCSDEY